MTDYFSFSKIDQYKQCPRKYKFGYIEKATVEKPVTVEIFLGSTVHRALEKLYNFKVNGRIQPEDEMLADYKKAWEGPDRDRIKVTREHMGIDDFIKIGSTALKKYYRMYHPFDEGEIIGLEKNVSFPLDRDNRYTMRAKLDKITLRKDKVVEIVDYKTGSRLPTQPEFDNNLQMALYHHAVNFLWPQFEKIELKQIFMRQGMVMATVMNQDRLDELRQITINTISEIEQATRDDDFPVKESALCDYCAYFELCPAKRHRRALEDEATDVINPQTGKELAEKYLKLNHEKKKIESEMKALKEDIIGYADKTDITRLEGDSGFLKITSTEKEGFPAKTENNQAFAKISLLARNAGLVECFKLEPNVLFKEFYSRKKLDEDLTEKLSIFVRKKRSDILRTSYNITDNNNQ
jgi:RecB family exonuclease